MRREEFEANAQLMRKHRGLLKLGEKTTVDNSDRAVYAARKLLKVSAT